MTKLRYTLRANLAMLACFAIASCATTTTRTDNIDESKLEDLPSGYEILAGDDIRSEVIGKVKKVHLGEYDPADTYYAKSGEFVNFKPNEVLVHTMSGYTNWTVDGKILCEHSESFEFGTKENYCYRVYKNPTNSKYIFVPSGAPEGKKHKYSDPVALLDVNSQQSKALLSKHNSMLAEIERGVTPQKSGFSMMLGSVLSDAEKALERKNKIDRGETDGTYITSIDDVEGGLLSSASVSGSGNVNSTGRTAADIQSQLPAHCRPLHASMEKEIFFQEGRQAEGVCEAAITGYYTWNAILQFSNACPAANRLDNGESKRLAIQNTKAYLGQTEICSHEFRPGQHKRRFNWPAKESKGPTPIDTRDTRGTSSSKPSCPTGRAWDESKGKCVSFN